MQDLADLLNALRDRAEAKFRRVDGLMDMRTTDALLAASFVSDVVGPVLKLAHRLLEAVESGDRTAFERAARELRSAYPC